MKFVGKIHFDYIDQGLRKEFEALMGDAGYHKTRTGEALEASQRFINKGVRDIRVTKASAKSFTTVKNRLIDIFKSKIENVTHVIKSINQVLESIDEKLPILKEKGYMPKAQELEAQKVDLLECIDRLNVQIEKVEQAQKDKILEVRNIIEKAERLKNYKKIQKKF